MKIYLIFTTIIVQVAPIFCERTRNKTRLEDIRKKDYCNANYTCSLTRHTICQRSHDCSGSPICESMSLNREWRKEILDRHNNYRHSFADTKEIGDISFLNYDLELEYIARCWANVCSGNVDQCRKTKKFQKVGQNEFRATTITGVPLEHLHLNFTLGAIDRWYNEMKYLTEWAWWGIKANRRAKRFFQIVWPQTTHIGCARSKSKTVFYFYCNYGPGLDLKKGEIKFGELPCSMCAKECNSEYLNLCGEVEEIPDVIISFAKTMKPPNSIVVINLIILYILVKHQC